MKNLSVRPTNVDCWAYLKFTLKCRKEGKNIGNTMTKLLKLYVIRGEKIWMSEQK